MSIIEFHRDLTRYSNKDIHKMARNEGLSGSVADLRWMLAIKHSMQSAEMHPALHNRAILGPLLEKGDYESIRKLCLIGTEIKNKCINFEQGFWKMKLKKEFPKLPRTDNEAENFRRYTSPVNVMYKDVLNLLEFYKLYPYPLGLYSFIRDYFANLYKSEYDGWIYVEGADWKKYDKISPLLREMGEEELENLFLEITLPLTFTKNNIERLIDLYDTQKTQIRIMHYAVPAARAENFPNKQKWSTLKVKTIKSLDSLLNKTGTIYTSHSAQMHGGSLFQLLNRFGPEETINMCSTSATVRRSCIGLTSGFWKMKLRKDFGLESRTDNNEENFHMYVEFYRVYKMAKSLQTLLQKRQLSELIYNYYERIGEDMQITGDEHRNELYNEILTSGNLQELIDSFNSLRNDLNESINPTPEVTKAKQLIDQLIWLITVSYTRLLNT